MKIARLGMTYVKCTKFLDIKRARLANYGIVGDREFVLVNDRNALLGPEQHARFLSLEFQFSHADNLLQLHYPDGRLQSGPVECADQCEVLDYLGMRDILLRKVVGDWDNWLSEYGRRNVRLYRCERPGAGVDVKPITFFTTASLRHLADTLGSEVDHRRFRANMVIEHSKPHIEDSWDGAILEIGNAKLRVRGSVPRCVVTQLNPDSGNDDLRVVGALKGYRERVRMPDGLMPQYATPGFASYAEVVSPGDIAVGDRIVVHRPAAD